MSVNVEHKDETVQGQGQDVRVREVRVELDEVILDPNSPLAVQVPPEGTSVGNATPAFDAFVDAESPDSVSRPLAEVDQPEVRNQSTVVTSVPEEVEESDVEPEAVEEDDNSE